MRLQADVKCYHCGDVSGTWVWPAQASPAVGLFRSASDPQGVVVPLRQIRCARCRGPVFLDDAQPVVERREMVVQRVRRGRPRKVASLAS